MSGHKKKTVHIPKPCRDYAKKFEDQTLIHEVNDRIEQKLSQILTEQKLYYREGQNFYSLDGSYFTRIRPENERILAGKLLQETYYLERKEARSRADYRKLSKDLLSCAEKTLRSRLESGQTCKELPVVGGLTVEQVSRLCAMVIARGIYEDYAARLHTDQVLLWLSQNRGCKDILYIQTKAAMLNEIPKDYTLLYPLAREMKRHFILHVGDTNTGKTYDAVQELMHAQSGVYLAPLRLLALEIQEKMLDAGVNCSMITGEEEDIREGATHMASTVEMLSLERSYDVCVIDEAQMIEDEYRGWAWTSAIMGVRAKRIHVCMSENARKIVTLLIENCHDTYEVQEHVRETELVFQSNKFHFPEDVRSHDALVVFSRREVLRTAAELEHLGYRPSAIYGALPYSVRKEEMRKFLDGETDIVVSTDAIGMGINLPIRRIVFLQSTKYDGKHTRYLKGSEVKQIAGRAGRKGMYDEGYVISAMDIGLMRHALYEPYEDIRRAGIQIPQKLFDLDMKLSEIILRWSQIEDTGIYRKAETEHTYQMCLWMEKHCPFEKATMWRLLSIPYDESSQKQEKLWKQLCELLYMGRPIYEGYEENLSDKTDLNSLEEDYRILDLYYSFTRAVGYDCQEFKRVIVETKEVVAEEIAAQLKDNKRSNASLCRSCGTSLPWGYPYRLCNDCFARAHHSIGRSKPYHSRRRS